MKLLFVGIITLLVPCALSLTLHDVSYRVKIGRVQGDGMQLNENATEHYRNLVATIIRLARHGINEVIPPYEPYQVTNLVTFPIKDSEGNKFNVKVHSLYANGLFDTKITENFVYTNEQSGTVMKLKVVFGDRTKNTEVKTNLTVTDSRDRVVLDGVLKLKLETNNKSGSFVLGRFTKDHINYFYRIDALSLRGLIRKVQVDFPPSARAVKPTKRVKGQLFDTIATGLFKHAICKVNKYLAEFSASQVNAYLGVKN